MALVSISETQLLLFHQFLILDSAAIISLHGEYNKKK